NDISITIADEHEDGSATIETDPEDPLAIIIHIEAETTTATAIVEAIEADEGANALVSCVIDEGDEEAAQVAATETSLTGGSDGAAVHGKAVYVNDDGHGCLSTDDDAVLTGAAYNGGVLTGVKEDGTTVAVAMVDVMGAL